MSRRTWENVLSVFVHSCFRLRPSHSSGLRLGKFNARTWILLRKEVIQPQVPLRLPCYDFIPVTTHTFGTYLPCGLDRRLRVQTASMM